MTSPVDMAFTIFILIYNPNCGVLDYYIYHIDIDHCMSNNLFIVRCNAFDRQSYVDRYIIIIIFITYMKQYNILCTYYKEIKKIIKLQNT